MNIIEKSIISKAINQEECEDGLFINDNFIVVIDGVTAKGEIVWDEKTSGRHVKDIILEALPKLDKDINAKDALEFINNNIKTAYKENYETAKNIPAERLQASLIIFSKNKRQIWNYGDCKCLINDNLYAHEKKIDIILSEVRSLYIQLALLEVITEKQIMENDPGREYILPLLKKQSLFANSDDSEYGFAVLDGININLNIINIYKVKENDEIVLASDGYPRLKNTLEASENELRKVLENDPLLINSYKSTKCLNKKNGSYDDRTYIRFIV